MADLPLTARYDVKIWKRHSHNHCAVCMLDLLSMARLCGLIFLLGSPESVDQLFEELVDSLTAALHSYL